jgi:tRNA-2-methylthio-N6-dimethylallyladenosine synthase
MIGRSPYLQSVHFEGGNARIGDMVNVSIQALSANSLAGRLARVAA